MLVVQLVAWQNLNFVSTILSKKPLNIKAQVIWHYLFELQATKTPWRFFLEGYHVWDKSTFSWSLSLGLYSLTPSFITFCILGMLLAIWKRRRWKEKILMPVYASNWSFSLILKRYKNTYTTRWQVFQAAVCCCVQSQIISFAISVLPLTLTRFYYTKFFVALAFFNVVWKVLLSKVFNCRRFIFRRLRTTKRHFIAI